MNKVIAPLLLTLLAFPCLHGAHADDTALLLEPPALVWGEIIQNTGQAPTEVKLGVVDGATTVEKDGRLLEKDGRLFFFCRMPARCGSPLRSGGEKNAALTLILDGKTRIALPPEASWKNDRLVRVDVIDGQAKVPGSSIIHGEVELVVDAATGEDTKARLHALLLPAVGCSHIRKCWKRRGAEAFEVESDELQAVAGDRVHGAAELVAPAGSVPDYTGRWLLEVHDMASATGPVTGNRCYRSVQPIRVQRRFAHYWGFPASASRGTPALPRILDAHADLPVTPSVEASAYAPVGARYAETYRFAGTASFGQADGTATTRISLLKDLSYPVEANWILQACGFASSGVGAGLLDGSRLLVKVLHDDAKGSGRSSTVFTLPLRRSRRTAMPDGIWWSARSFLDIEGGIEGAEVDEIELELSGKALAGSFDFRIEDLTIAEPVTPTLDY